MVLLLPLVCAIATAEDRQAVIKIVTNILFKVFASNTEYLHFATNRRLRQGLALRKRERYDFPFILAAQSLIEVVSLVTINVEM